MTEAITAMWVKLGHPQQTAIEMKYLGHSYTAISERLGGRYAAESIRNWFRDGGALQAIYNEYTKSLNEERRDTLRKHLALADEEWLTHTTNAVRVWAKFNTQGHQVPLLNKQGQLVYDKEGKKLMTDYVPNIRFSDVMRAFSLQRTLQNRPDHYDPRTASPQENIEVEQAIKDLNLTELDFTEENEEATYKRIREYLDKK